MYSALSIPTTEKRYLLEELIKNTRTYLDYFFEHANIDSFQTVIDSLLKCKGTIFVTGIGKSGIIAKKIAMTISSCGTKALWLSPTNALHGDIGLVTQDDFVLFLSKSGESDELLQLCHALRTKNTHLVAVVSNGESRLAKACDLVVELPVYKELCPFDIAPTTSTLVQLIFGDLLAMSLMRAKNFTVEGFAQNHPAGRIGKRLIFRVKDLMITGERVPVGFEYDRLVDILVELSNKKCGCVLITNEKRELLGIFTDGDLRRSLQRHGAEVLHKPMNELMNRSPRFTRSDILAYEALQEMESDSKSLITALPVVDNNELVGILKLHDVVQSGL